VTGSWGERLAAQALPAVAGGGIFALLGGLAALALPTAGYGCASGGSSPVRDGLCQTPLRDIGLLGGVVPLVDAAVRVGAALALLGVVVGLVAWSFHEDRVARPAPRAP
jgi:hypothetical protein